METKVLDNGASYTRVKSQDGRHSIQFLTLWLNHEKNRDTLGGKGREEFLRGLSRCGAAIVRTVGQNPTRVP